MNLAERLFNDGREKGRIETLKASFKEILTAKFQDSPTAQAASTSVATISNPQILRQLITKAALAQTPDDILKGLR